MTLATGAAASPGTGGLSILILALPILLLVWLMLSQRRRTKALGEAQQALQVGQEVLTTSGMHGVVAGLESEVVQLRIAEGVVVRMDRRAVVPLSIAQAGPGRATPGSTNPGSTNPGSTDPGSTNPDAGGTNPR